MSLTDRDFRARGDITLSELSETLEAAYAYGRAVYDRASWCGAVYGALAA